MLLKLMLLTPLPFTTNVLMIGPDQIINVLVIAYQTFGRYYMVTHAYQMVYKYKVDQENGM